MRRGSIFWGFILVLLGGLFLLQAQGLITDVFSWFWPIALILVGAWIVFGRFIPRGGSSGETFSINLEGASKIDMDFDHGAGTVVMTGGAPSGVALTGLQGAGMDVKSHLSGDGLTIDLDAGPTFIPFIGPDGGEWRFQITQEVPVNLKVDSGASTLIFDFTDVKLAFLGIDTGASSLNVKLPANAGSTLVDIESGAASIDLSIPQGVAARIRVEQGVSSVDIDESRFPISGSMHQSPDFDSAANKVEINLEGGANSVKIR